MEAHPENFQFIVLELLGITIDSKLDFKEDIYKIMKKRIINYIP